MRSESVFIDFQKFLEAMSWAGRLCFAQISLELKFMHLRSRQHNTSSLKTLPECIARLLK